MIAPSRYAVVAIPLSRPEIVDFLVPPQTAVRGAPLWIVGQRPTDAAEADWIADLRRQPAASAPDLLAIDDPHTHLTPATTDRLVPVELLAEDDFLTRALGGWIANYFGVAGLPPALPDDPLFNALEILADYGPAIRYCGADPALVAERLPEETGLEVSGVAPALIRRHAIRAAALGPAAGRAARMAYVAQLYAALASGVRFGDGAGPPLPELLLYDELMGQLVSLELRRRAAVAAGEEGPAAEIAAWQARQKATSGLELLLKGEYIVGRHRRSTVLLAPELGVVVKQPAPEPFHEIALHQRIALGRPENWPYLTHDGALVTARGRLRLILEENIVPRISRAFGYGMRFSALFGLTLESYVVGQTVQDVVLADPRRLNADLYEQVVLHQLVCEALGIENGDWHAPNFVLRDGDGALFHVDWGAARPLRPDEQTADGRRARLNQVSNMAFSFKDETLAARLMALHQALLANGSRLARLRQAADLLASQI